MNKYSIYLFATILVVMAFAYLHVSTSTELTTVHQAAIDRVGFEDTPAMVRIYASPAIKWEAVPTSNKVVGLVFLFLSVASIILSPKVFTGKSQAILCSVTVFGLLLLSCIALYAGYSNSLDQGSIELTLSEFNKIKDNPEALKSLFTK